MAVRIEANVEPIPGYRLIERLGGGGFGEVWKCEAPGGLHKAIKFVFGNLELAGDSGHRAEQELKALSRVKTVRHPYVLSLERFDVIDGQLIIIMELADRNLWDRYKECRGQGLPGIPRDELLGYIREASEALDLMNIQYQLQHLDIKPQNLFLVHQHVKVADFGLVKDFEGSQASVTGGITPVYAAPETFDGRVTRFSDQYSLAIVYQELLTGQRPFAGVNVRQLILQHLEGEPNLAPLDPHDQPVVYRALSKKPEDRYPTCTDFVQALMDAGMDPEAGLPSVKDTPVDPHGPATPPLQQRAHRPPVPAPAPVRARESGQSQTHFIGVPGGAARAEAPVPPAPPRAPQPVPVPVSRPPDTPLPAFRDTDRGGALAPTLLVGVGGVGAQVLQSFRTLLAGEFGSAGVISSLRLLLIDTDPDVLKLGGLPPEAAERVRELCGPPAQPLTPSDTLIAALNRPSHYLRPQPGRVAVDTWLGQRMIYRIPREQVTSGVRALGRLALTDHARVIQRRLQMELEACRDPMALEMAAKTTGLGIRSSHPRVFLVASLMGGTGGGMFLDLAYMIRALLRQMGHVPQIAGLLFIPQLERRASAHPNAPTRPTDGSSHQGIRPSAQGTSPRVMPVGNAYAALTELLHYAQPDVEFKAHYFDRDAGLHDFEPPFTPTFLMPLPSGPLKKESQETIGMAAHFLFGECASSFGRWRGTRPEIDPPGDPLYRTFGLYRLSFPRAPVIHQVATRALKQVIERWISKDARRLVEDVHEWVVEQWRGNDLGAEHFIERVRSACESRLGKEPERAFAAAIEPLLARFPPADKGRLLSRVRGNAPIGPPDPDDILDVLLQFEQLLGRPQVTNEDGVYRSADWGGATRPVEVTGKPDNTPEMTVKLEGQSEAPVGQLVEFLREVASTIATEWSQKLAELPVNLIELPVLRLAGAEEAVRQVVDTIQGVLLRHEPLGHELADKAAEAYGKLLAFLGSIDSSRSWPRRGPGPEQLAELLRTYAKSRYQSLVLQQVLSVYVSLRGCLTDELREINFCRPRLQELLGHLEGEKAPERAATSMPEMSPLVEGRVKYLFPEEWGNLQQAVTSISATLTDEDLLQLDTRLQKMIRSSPAFHSLVTVCISSKNMTKDLARALRVVAVEFMEERLDTGDLPGLLLSRSGEKQEAATEELMACYEEAVPEPAASGRGTPPWERIVIGVPPGDAGNTLRDLVRNRLADSDLVLAGSENDLLIYREWVGLRLVEVDPLGPAGREAYDCLLSTEHFTPHSRGDVTFEPPR